MRFNKHKIDTVYTKDNIIKMILSLLIIIDKHVSTNFV